ncbi:LacI family DNA-binding transcriptional regulator [Pseudalkalibacillus salsuginis]|uniref:LacI family DNA-binding transcriptional regulator n=1 Tax=Pseudalkalibacillus salsuginis TaxID=2910972 RepID=UPI001F2AF50C|nr:LacI family DNA-binding transcriptional regulator [Pseudalkalibacillus salsuginis]MCF6409883.1 LacI family DNA-binding transcriptional regulator [Pseudalkalibacillus salsuginis]
MTNIRDVAKSAGVSVTTVSRVLNNHPYVSEEKRKLVLKAIEEMKYHININAVHLTKGVTKLIGVVIPFINHPYFSSILDGIANEARKNDYKLILFQTDYDLDKEIEALEMLRMKQIDSLIICSRECKWSIIEEYETYGPIVVCEDGENLGVKSVYIDHYQAFKTGLDHLVNRGHKRIGYCIGRRTGKNSEQREAAYLDTLEKIDEPVHEDWIFDQAYTIVDGEKVVHRFMHLVERPTALLVTSDQVAAGILMQCSKEHIRIADELSIISFDNHPISEYLQLTTIDLPLEQMGKELLGAVLKPDPVRNRQMPFRLIERKSVKTL